MLNFVLKYRRISNNIGAPNSSAERCFLLERGAAPSTCIRMKLGTVGPACVKVVNGRRVEAVVCGERLSYHKDM